MWNTLAKHNEIDEKSNYLQLLIVQLFNGMPNFSTFGIIIIDWPLIIYVSLDNHVDAHIMFAIVVHRTESIRV